MKKPLFILKPNWDILGKYGYFKPDYSWVNNYKYYKDQGREEEVVFDHLNNIQSDGIKIYNSLMENAVGIDENLLDTIIYIAIFQADLFYGNLEAANEINAQFDNLKQLAIIIKAFKEADEHTSLIFKKGKYINATINSFDVFALLNKLLGEHISRPGFFSDIININDKLQYSLPDFLKLDITNAELTQVNLTNILRTIFISKTHEVIKNEIVYYHSKPFITRKQRQLIYDIGVCFSIFPAIVEWEDRDFLKHLYRDNIKLLKHIQQKKGSVTIP